MQTVTVELADRSYPIYIGQNLLDNRELLTRHILSQQVMLVSNDRVGPLYLKKLQTALADRQCDSILLPDGEQHKNLQVWTKIFDALIDHRHYRTTTLIALGGGVICDMTGFAAACYQRGVSYLQIPTSLLAQVDASIGGKTAVNHPKAKNMIGSFYQPQCVIIDTSTLKTLPERELSAGIAEIIKTALIADEAFFSWLESNLSKLLLRDPIALEYAIKKACAIKAEIVAQDEKDLTGIRALVNFGHTFGHAIEQLLGYGTWLHGEAVATGMVLAAQVSVLLGQLTEHDLQRIKQLLIAAKLPIRLPEELQYDKMLSAMTIDKKMVDTGLRLVLLQGIGKAELTNRATLEQVTRVLSDVK